MNLLIFWNVFIFLQSCSSDERRQLRISKEFKRLPDCHGRLASAQFHAQGCEQQIALLPALVPGAVPGAAAGSLRCPGLPGRHAARRRLGHTRAAGAARTMPQPRLLGRAARPCGARARRGAGPGAAGGRPAGRGRAAAGGGDAQPAAAASIGGGRLGGRGDAHASRPAPARCPARPRAERSGPAPGRPQPMEPRPGGRSGPARRGPAPHGAAGPGSGARGVSRAPLANGPSALQGCGRRQGSSQQPRGRGGKRGSPTRPSDGACAAGGTARSG